MKPKQAIEKVAAFIKRLAFDKKLHYFAGLLNQEGNAGICRLLMDDRRGYNVAYFILRRFGHRLGVDKLGFYTSI